MGEVKIIMPSGSFGAAADDDTIDTAMRIIGVAFGSPDEWASKYGTDYENDVFMMHRYCWCESDDCPWCAGCGAFEDICKVCSAQTPHDPNCYGRLVMAAPRAKQERLARKLCGERGLDFGRIAWGIHCDCGAQQKDAERRKTDGCDYVLGTGIFQRFGAGKYDEDYSKGAPNFWFKPTNFKLAWYKYIGRSMETNSAELPVDFMQQVFASHPNGVTLDQAIAEFAKREEESAASFAEMFAKLGVEVG